MKSSKLLEGISLLLAAQSLLGCRQGDEAPRGSEPAPRLIASATEHRAGLKLVVAAAAHPEPSPDEAASGASALRGEAGSWADSSAYRFKVSGNQRCARRTAAGGTGDAGGLFALSVDVFAKYDELLVASRDVKLESAGIILEREIDPKVDARCGALLRTQRIKQGQTASGVVLFAVPPEFDTRSVVVSYQATRWGGAPRLEVKLPPSAFSVPEKR